jgi:hypothetical protein
MVMDVDIKEEIEVMLAWKVEKLSIVRNMLVMCV